MVILMMLAPLAFLSGDILFESEWTDGCNIEFYGIFLDGIYYQSSPLYSPEGYKLWWDFGFLSIQEKIKHTAIVFAVNGTSVSNHCCLRFKKLPKEITIMEIDHPRIEKIIEVKQGWKILK